MSRYFQFEALFYKDRIRLRIVSPCFESNDPYARFKSDRFMKQEIKHRNTGGWILLRTACNELELPKCEKV